MATHYPKSSVEEAESHRIGVLTSIQIPSLARLETLSDGIFAIVMTLLILDVKLPTVLHNASSEDFNSALFAIWPKVGAYVISFLVLAKCWEIHRQIFHFVKRSDNKILWANNFCLLLITLLPFSTSLISEYPQFRLVSALYCGNMLALPFLMLLIWKHAASQMASNGVPDWVIREGAARGVKVTASFAVVFVASLFSSAIGISLLLILVSMSILVPLFRSERVREEEAQKTAAL